MSALAQALHGCLCRKLNKLGTFNLAQLGSSSGKKNPIAEFMRSQRKNNDNFEESLLKLVRARSRGAGRLPPCAHTLCHSLGCNS